MAHKNRRDDEKERKARERRMQGGKRQPSMVVQKGLVK